MTGPDRLWLWAGVSGPDDPSSRVEAAVCPCGGLVPADRFDRHRRWHRQHGRESAQD